jgi:hypothetical protein
VVEVTKKLLLLVVSSCGEEILGRRRRAVEVGIAFWSSIYIYMFEEKEFFFWF